MISYPATIPYENSQKGPVVGPPSRGFRPRLRVRTSSPPCTRSWPPAAGWSAPIRYIEDHVDYLLARLLQYHNYLASLVNVYICVYIYTPMYDTRSYYLSHGKVCNLRQAAQRPSTVSSRCRSRKSSCRDLSGRSQLRPPWVYVKMSRFTFRYILIQ